MCKLVLDRGNFAEFTSVSNIFIDEYMPKANGEFIKIYLHLLRLVGADSPAENLSTERIADKFNILEADVLRALNYWADQGLLSLSFNNRDELSGIKLESAVSNRYIVKGIHTVTSADDNELSSVAYEETLAKASGQNISVPVPECSGTVIPAKKKYSAKEISAFSQDERVSQLTFLAQTYLGKTLSPADVNSILYMLDGLEFETNFIEYIMETCISLGHRSLSAIEKQAVEYASRNISTIEDAKADEKLRRAIFKSIYKVFGLAPQAPIKKEISYVTKWSDEYGFSDEIILEACHRTMEHTHTGSFQYADSILANWFSKGAKSMPAIEQLDAAHSEEVNASLKSKPAYKSKAASSTKKQKSFEQRTYNYDELELQLIAERDKKLSKNKNNND